MKTLYMVNCQLYFTLTRILMESQSDPVVVKYLSSVFRFYSFTRRFIYGYFPNSFHAIRFTKTSPINQNLFNLILPTGLKSSGKEFPFSEILFCK